MFCKAVAVYNHFPTIPRPCLDCSATVFHFHTVFRFCSTVQGLRKNKALIPISYCTLCTCSFFLMHNLCSIVHVYTYPYLPLNSYILHVCLPRKRNNSESLLRIGLNLVTVALESGGQSLCGFPSLAQLVQDMLSRNLFTVS